MPERKKKRYFGLLAVSLIMMLVLLFLRGISGATAAGLGATMWAVVAFFAFRGDIENIRKVSFAMLIIVSLAGLVLFSQFGTSSINSLLDDPRHLLDVGFSFLPWLFLFLWAEAKEDEQRRANLLTILTESPLEETAKAEVQASGTNMHFAIPNSETVSKSAQTTTAPQNREDRVTKIDSISGIEDSGKQLEIALSYRSDLQVLIAEAKEKGQGYMSVVEQALLADPRISSSEVQQLLQRHETQLNRPFKRDEVNDAWQQVKALEAGAEQEFKSVIQTLGENIDVEFVLKQLSARFRKTPSTSPRLERLPLGLYFTSSRVAFQVRPDESIQTVEFWGDDNEVRATTDPWIVKAQFAKRIGGATIGDVIFVKNGKRKKEPIVRFPDGRLVHAITAEEFRTLQDVYNALGTQGRDRLGEL